MTGNRTPLVMTLIALLVVALGFVGWVLVPERALHWGAGIATMIAVWLVLVWSDRRDSGSRDTTEYRFRGVSGVLAGLLLASSMSVAILRATEATGGSSLGSWIDRLPGIVMGGVLAVMGNYVPKLLTPRGAPAGAPRTKQSMRRFTGWTFVLAGIGYAAVWAFLPVAVADPLATGLCATAVAIVFLRVGWTTLATGRNRSRES